MKSYKRKLIIGLYFCSVYTSSAYAATAQCVGKVTEVGNHVPGGVHVRVAAAGITKICDLNALYFRTTPADCKQHLATAMLALATGKTVSLWIDNAVTTACTATGVPEWSGSDVRYLSIIP